VGKVVKHSNRIPLIQKPRTTWLPMRLMPDTLNLSYHQGRKYCRPYVALTVEIRLSSDVKEPYVIINAGTLTPEVEELAKRIENEKLTGNILAVKRENLIYILEHEDI